MVLPSAARWAATAPVDSAPPMADDGRTDPPSGALEQLVSPFGVVSAVRRLRSPRGLARLANYVALGGGRAPGVPPASRRPESGDGCGRVLDDTALGRLIAVAEAAERYAAGDFLRETVVWARAGELDGPTLDTWRIARCSPREYGHPRCPVRPFDADAAIRWVLGFDLATGERTWVPAVMACYALRDVRPEEAFVYRLSTGYAVHTDPTEALVQGVCEVVERDAAAVAWLQCLPLPLIVENARSEQLDHLLSWGARHFLDSYLFDATTDVGLPTVCCLQVAHHDPRAHQTMGCGTGRTIVEAAEKALLEATTVRAIYTSEDPVPDSPADFANVDHGARFMGRAERRAAFDFLVDGAARRPRSEHVPWPRDPATMLERLVSTLTGLGMQVLAVDRTPRELAAVGLTAVSVVIPDLQPLSLAPLAQFRAHPRLSALPPALGYPNRNEEEQNLWPHPLA
ncbi:YcaO-like family protein [Streptantibioticus rubrisoli]|uniref:YcaO-like family protein n=1 Tax=Streptantibioticus rubrisoli TaxID=1387313 RepID=A0ABT1PD88_9ACTN|nr:YcaO-like family protein [Streptantibioticus rubrisoli]MCQ4042781.1 YcaO-like family protein [Streptantibioticus rubrisoli]